MHVLTHLTVGFVHLWQQLVEALQRPDSRCSSTAPFTGHTDQEDFHSLPVAPFICGHCVSRACIIREVGRAISFQRDWFLFFFFLLLQIRSFLRCYLEYNHTNNSVSTTGGTGAPQGPERACSAPENRRLGFSSLSCTQEEFVLQDHTEMI